MKKYQCHKVVEAAKIVDIKLPALLSEPIVLYLDGGEAVVSSEWEGKHGPKRGGYFVRYEDGYASYSPAGAFERGYTEIEE